MALILFLIVTLAAGSAAAQVPSEALRVRTEQVHEEQVTTVGGARLLRADAVAHVFEARSFAPAWSEADAAEILQAIRGIDQDGLIPGDYHLAAIVYWTVSVGASGELRFARDVYALDGAVLQALGRSADRQTVR